jgi:arylsulfatase A-like enzyme/Flp pilus assembly protein TadD
MKIKAFSKFSMFLLGLAMVVIVGTVWFLLYAHQPIRNVVLISIDTCRADYLSCYGYPHKTTPNIDSVAQESILFRNVISPVPLTLPSHCSILTGTIPAYHGVHDNENDKLVESNVTLAEILRQNGFATGAVVSTFVLDSRFGLDQGFDSYNDEFEKRAGKDMVAERRGGEANHFAINWLAEHKNEKFFLFLHYFDPHHTYLPPEPFASLYHDNLYAGEIAYTDYCIGQVIAELKTLGLYDSTLIVITGDHGEMLGEHGEPYHGYFIYQSAIKVPLIIKLPGQTESQKIKQAVGLIDIAPTICKMVGLKMPPQVQGKDLSAYFYNKQEALPERHLYSECMNPTQYNANSLLGVVTDRFKYIQTTRPELYDLLADPGETNNLIKQQPQQARMLQERLREILEQTVGKNESDSKIELDEESRKRLESLGYVAGTGPKEDFEFDQSKDDPKDVLVFYLEEAKIVPLMLKEKYDEAMIICRKLVEQRPGLWQIHYRMGEIATKQGRHDAAISHWQEAIRLDDPQGLYVYRSHKRLGMSLALQDRIDVAAEHYEKSLELKADQPVVLDNLAHIYYRQSKIQQAIDCWSRALQFKPDWPDVLNNLAWGKAAYKNENFHNPTEAISLAQHACELTGYRKAMMLDTLAVAYAAAGNFPEAVKTAEKAIELAVSEKQNELASKIRDRLELYKSSRTLP